MTDVERVYAEWVLARSFACKKCGYGSTNRHVIEQHLRQSHPELFAPPPSLSQHGTQNAERGARNGTEAGADAASSPLLASRSREEIIFYTDAGTWHNGTARQRSVLAVWDGRTRSVVIEEELPGTTNNEAEYAAIIAALELARNERLSGVRIRSDSQLCVRQIKGEWQLKEERLRPLRDRAARLLAELHGSIEWVPREHNQAGIYLERKYKKERHKDILLHFPR